MYQTLKTLSIFVLFCVCNGSMHENITSVGAHIDTKVSLKNANATSVLVPKNSTREDVLLIDSEIHSWSTPNPYSEGHALVIKADDGYKIAVTLSKCDIEGDDGDFLLIKRGASVEDDGTGKIFTFNIDKPRKYMIPSNVVLIKFEVFGDNLNKKSGFTVEYQRYGEPAPTTEPTTPGVTWPTPSGHDSVYLRVNISGKSDEEFKQDEVLNSFKNATADMATEYCHSQNIVLKENITLDNVHIQELIRCPITWIDHEKCVQIQFALPVFIDDNATAEEWRGYQLTTGHLHQMWTRLSNKYLQIYGFSIYTVPDYNKATIVWVAIIVVIIILVIVMLGLIALYGSSMKTTIGRRMSDTTAIISSKRSSTVSLGPPPSQSIPPLFENDYPLYEPNNNSNNSVHRGQLSSNVLSKT